MEKRIRTHIVFLLVTNFLFSATFASKENFTGHRLFRVVPLNEQHLEILQKLHYHPPAKLKHLDFWTEPMEPGEGIFVGVRPDQRNAFERFLFRHKISHQIVYEDLQKVLEEHAIQNQETRLNEETSIYDTFLTFDEAMDWLRRMMTRCGGRCSILNIGRSFEGRNMTLIKVSSTSSSDANPTGGKTSRKRRRETSGRPAVWIDGGIHAREWIAPAAALYFIDRLILNYDVDPEVRYLVDTYDWFILPFVNPDGYQYSHVKNRLWRKTRSKPSPEAECVGVDANRNFDFHWKSVGYEDDACSYIYPGRRPFSELETQSLSDFILSRNGTWKLFLTLHSYGQLLMSPYGYTTSKPNGYKKMMTAASVARAAIENVYKTDYTIGSASDVLYRSSGTSRDWAAGVARIPYVYTIELRDRGDRGFLLPPNQILPSGIETWEGVKALVLAIEKLEQSTTMDNY